MDRLVLTIIVRIRQVLAAERQRAHVERWRGRGRGRDRVAQETHPELLEEREVRERGAGERVDAVLREVEDAEACERRDALDALDAVLADVELLERRRVLEALDAHESVAGHREHLQRAERLEAIEPLDLVLAEEQLAQRPQALQVLHLLHTRTAHRHVKSPLPFPLFAFSITLTQRTHTPDAQTQPSNGLCDNDKQSGDENPSDLRCHRVSLTVILIEVYSYLKPKISQQLVNKVSLRLDFIENKNIKLETWSSGGSASLCVTQGHIFHM